MELEGVDDWTQYKLDSPNLAVVAWGRTPTFLHYIGSQLAFDIEEGGIDAEDVLYGVSGQLKEIIIDNGIFAIEIIYGKGFYNSYYGEYDGPEPIEVKKIELSEEELLNAIKGKPPWNVEDWIIEND